MANGFEQPERNPIWILGIIAIGLIVIFSGIAYAYVSGAFVSHVTSYRPIDTNTGKVAEERIIYGQAQVSFGQLRVIPSYVNGISTLLSPAKAVPAIVWTTFATKNGVATTISPLQIDIIRLGDKSFDYGFAPLFWGSGEVKCRAKLTYKDVAHAGLQDSEEAVQSFADFGGLTTEKKNFNFILKGYKGQKYDITVLCQSEKGYQITAQRELLT